MFLNSFADLVFGGFLSDITGPLYIPQRLFGWSNDSCPEFFISFFSMLQKDYIVEASSSQDFPITRLLQQGLR